MNMTLFSWLAISEWNNSYQNSDTWDVSGLKPSSRFSAHPPPLLWLTMPDNIPGVVSCRSRQSFSRLLAIEGHPVFVHLGVHVRTITLFSLTPYHTLRHLSRKGFEFYRVILAIPLDLGLQGLNRRKDRLFSRRLRHLETFVEFARWDIYSIMPSAPVVILYFTASSSET